MATRATTTKRLAKSKVTARQTCDVYSLLFSEGLTFHGAVVGGGLTPEFVRFVFPNSNDKTGREQRWRCAVR